MKENWFVYILECNDNSFYTGITKDVEKRMEKHSQGKGSKYVKQKGFKKLLKTRCYKNKSEALKHEYRIKQLSRKKKIEWFNCF
jgi:putative endonuclease